MRVASRQRSPQNLREGVYHSLQGTQLIRSRVLKRELLRLLLVRSVGRGEATPLIFEWERPGGEQGASRSEVLGRGLRNGDSHTLGFFGVAVSLWVTTHPLGQIFRLELKHPTLCYIKMLFFVPCFTHDLAKILTLSIPGQLVTFTTVRRNVIQKPQLVLSGTYLCVITLLKYKDQIPSSATQWLIVETRKKSKRAGKIPQRKIYFTSSLGFFFFFFV